MARAVAVDAHGRGEVAVRAFDERIDWSGYVFVAFFGLPFLIFNICPILFGASSSASPNGASSARRSGSGLDNFREAFADEWVGIAFRNTLLYGCIIVPGVVVLALAFALFVNQGWPLVRRSPARCSSRPTWSRRPSSA